MVHLPCQQDVLEYLNQAVVEAGQTFHFVLPVKNTHNGEDTAHTGKKQLTHGFNCWKYGVPIIVSTLPTSLITYSTVLIVSEINCTVCFANLLVYCIK